MKYGKVAKGRITGLAGPCFTTSWYAVHIGFTIRCLNRIFLRLPIAIRICILLYIHRIDYASSPTFILTSHKPSSSTTYPTTPTNYPDC